jgi:hypothetical protein
MTVACSKSRFTNGTACAGTPINNEQPSTQLRRDTQLLNGNSD